MNPEDFEDIFEQYEEVMEYMLENSYIEEIGIDEDGEPIYKMSPEMMKDFPDIFNAHMEVTNELLFSVWQKGYVEMTMTEDGEWLIIPTDVTLNYEEIPNLTKEERLLLWELSEMKKRDYQ
jgi:hypothetical protein